jgi:hypothetical protein
VFQLNPLKLSKKNDNNYSIAGNSNLRVDNLPIEKHIQELNVWIWGHGMVRPSPGLPCSYFHRSPIISWMDSFGDSAKTLKPGFNFNSKIIMCAHKLEGNFLSYSTDCLTSWQTVAPWIFQKEKLFLP